MTKLKDEFWDEISVPGSDDSNEWQIIDQIVMESEHSGETNITDLAYEYARLRRLKPDHDIKLVMVNVGPCEKEALNAYESAIVPERETGHVIINHRCCGDK
jgi:hypothetical protein